MASSGRMSAVKGGTGSISTPANNISPPSPTSTRNSPPTSKFAGLTNQKRNSVDAAAAARRQSFHDQKPATGFIGQMWHNFTKGPTK